MRREELVDLNAFMAITEEQNFTRAAAKLGTSQSAVFTLLVNALRFAG
jgi:DNA-binding transcriptional LysR family regulator